VLEPALHERSGQQAKSPLPAYTSTFIGTGNLGRIPVRMRWVEPTYANCADSVDPSMAPVEALPAVMTFLISSK